MKANPPQKIKVSTHNSNRSKNQRRPKSSEWASSTITVKWISSRMNQPASMLRQRLLPRRPAQMTIFWGEGGRKWCRVKKVVAWVGWSLMSRKLQTHRRLKWERTVERICLTSHSSGNLMVISHINGILRKKAPPCNKCWNNRSRPKATKCSSSRNSNFNTWNCSALSRSLPSRKEPIESTLHNPIRKTIIQRRPRYDNQKRKEKVEWIYG